MKKIYISGKITGLQIEDAEAKFKSAEEKVTEMGAYPVNPMKIVPFHPDHKWEHYMAADIKELLSCHAIYMLPCWGQSKGARVEYAIARELGLEIIFA